MTVLESTVEKLKVLPENKPEAVSHYIDTLNSRPKGRFDKLAGCLTDDEAELLEKAIADEHPRVRLEAVRALSFCSGDPAIELALEVLERDIDDYLMYTLDETMSRLEQ